VHVEGAGVRGADSSGVLDDFFASVLLRPQPYLVYRTGHIRIQILPSRHVQVLG